MYLLSNRKERDYNVKNKIDKSLDYVKRVYEIRNEFPSRVVRSVVMGQFIPRLSKFLPKKITRGAALNKHNLIEKYLMDHYGYVVSEYQKREYSNFDDFIPHKIWTFWYQGEKQAPDIVKACIKSLRESIQSTDIELIVLDKNNFQKYVELPSYILDKKDNGSISLTEFSDILRSSLLAEYGGMWIDSTVYSVRPIDIDIFQQSFFTLHFFSGTIWSPAVAHHRWNTYFMGIRRNDRFFCFVRDFLYAYWKNESYLIDYLLLDYVMDLASKNFNDIKQMIDKVPITNIECLKLNDKLDIKYKKSEIIKLMDDTSFFKLTYKYKIEKNDMNVYSALLDKKIWMG